MFLFDGNKIRSIWGDKRFLSLSWKHKLVVLYILTGQSNRIGLFAVDWDTAAWDMATCNMSLDNSNEESSCSPEEFFRQAAERLQWGYDAASKVVWVSSWWHYCQPRNERELTEWMEDLKSVPANPFLDEFCKNTNGLSPKLAAAFARIVDVARNGERPRAVVKTVGPANGDHVVLEFPTVGAGAKTWQLTSNQVEEWEQLYPGTDVLRECRRALAWLLANPSRQKTSNGMKRFLVNWLNRAQNSGAGFAGVRRNDGDPRGNIAIAQQYLNGGF